MITTPASWFNVHKLSLRSRESIYLDLGGPSRRQNKWEREGVGDLIGVGVGGVERGTVPI
jgi:hypothetical protein